MSEKLKIIVVDDHEFFRKGVTMTINKFKYTEVVGEAENGDHFLRLLEKKGADIVFMDVKMPLMDGIEATRLAMKKYPKLKIVALSMFGEEEYLESMLEAGATGFIIKNISKDDLERAIQVIAQDKQYFSEELLPYFTNRFRKKEDKEPEAKLTGREKEILMLIAEGLTNQEMATKLHLSVRTVTNHRANLNMKTGSKNTAHLLSYAMRNNLIEI